MTTVDITPSPRVLRMLGQIDFAPWQCLAELIDNSIDAFIDQARDGVPAVEPKIWVDVPGEKELKAGRGELIVRDNGSGMSIATLQDAVRAGYSGNDPVEKMGLFGMGFNISTARMGRKTEIWTTRADDPDWTGLVIDFDHLEQQKTFNAPVQLRAKTNKELEDQAHGTEIKITRLEVDRVMPLIKGVGKRRTREKLGKIYGRVMRRLEIEINYSGDAVTPTKHCVWDAKRSVETKAFGNVPARIEIDETLDTRKFCSTCWVWLSDAEDDCPACGHRENIVKRSRKLTGWLGIQRFFDKETFGIDLIRNGRVIQELDKSFFTFSGEDGDTILEYPIDAIHWGGRIVGELEIDFVRVSHQKDSFDKLDPEWKKVVNLVRGNSPLQPQIAKRLGLAQNTSPMARLFTGYRKGTAGLSSLVPGTSDGTGVNAGLVKEYVDKFYAGDPDFQDDDKWYELVLQAERAKRGGSSGADDFAGDFPIGDETASSGNDEEPTGDVDDDAGTSHNDSAEEIQLPDPDPALSRTYEVPELPGDILIKVTALRHKTDLGGHPYRVTPKGFDLQFDYNGDSPYFEDNVLQPSDYLIVDVAQQAITVASQSIRDYPVSYVGRLLRDKYFPSNSGDISQAAKSASALLGELRRHFDENLPNVAPIDLEDIVSHELDHIRRVAFRSESLTNAQADECIRNGEFARFASEDYLQDLVEIWPSIVMDGDFFDRPYEPLSTDQRRQTLSQVVECLKDASWLVEDGASAINKDRDWRLRFTRALASLRLLESWAK
ncbi:ATP-binding protein [Ruegeria sp. 6PALISEP08]|uniref:ATP-binding protein n=1 Tax=Ruegeria sp. 6PALISEP08 TaxID=1225660 RepID=UPI00067ECA19|nr:ATP-binding protein [Ruegeria sp. 6PALISEP08]